MCRSGEVLQGLIKPHECAAFGKRVHAAQPARRDDGLARGRLRRVLPLPPARAARRADAGGEPRWLSTDRAAPSTSRAGPARCRCATRPTIVMGHGGGGAMSAELIEHLFLPAFGDARPDAELGDSAVLDARRRAAGVLDRLVRGPAAVLPRRHHRRPRGQRHGQRPGDERARTPLYLSTAFILEEGTALAEHRPRSPQALGAAARGGRRPAGHRRHQGGRRRARRRRLRQHRRHRAGRRRASTSGPHRAAAGDVVIVSGDIGVHGVAVMSVPRGAGVRHRRSRATPRRCTGWSPAMLGHRRRRARAARPDPRRPGRVAERDRPGRRRRGRAGRARRCRSRRGRATPARCSASTRCTSPTRASCVAFVPPRARRRGAGRDAGAPARRAAPP